MKKVTDQEILTKVYVNRKEVEQLLQMPREPVAKLFSQIQKKEQEALGEYYVWGQKVRLKSVLESQGLSMQEMQRIVMQRNGKSTKNESSAQSEDSSKNKKNQHPKNITH